MQSVYVPEQELNGAEMGSVARRTEKKGKDFGKWWGIRATGSDKRGTLTEIDWFIRYTSFDTPCKNISADSLLNMNLFIQCIYLLLTHVSVSTACYADLSFRIKPLWHIKH